ncbi:MAG: hypothetical protein LAO18_08885 [Acidobacteriia bacterium]|nr:hypothetical protein [Terriglobia bacterium]
MSLHTRSRNLLRTSILVFASMTISVLAWAQHRTESGGQSEHAGNPGRPSGQDRGGHASGPSRESSHGQRDAAGTQPGRTAGAPTSRPGNAGNRGGNTSEKGSGNSRGNRGVNARDNRGGNTPANRSGNAEGNRGRNPSGNRGGYNAGNRGGMPNRRAPGRTVTLKGGGSASFRPNGQIRVIHRDGMRIQHNLRGGRTIVTERRGVRIVTRGGGRGYVQRTYVTRGGRAFYSRTYYSHGVYRVGVYRGYYYHRHYFYGYYPPYWYHPAFYLWAYRPWGPPVYWGVGIGGWGWGPWYGYYGGYFAPYSVYPSAAFWLTDYVIAANLQAAYEARAQANADAAAYDQGQTDYGNSGGQAANNGPVTLTPEVKQAIAEEVKAQLEAQQQQAQGAPGGQAQAAQPTNDEVPPALDPARRTFVVASDITVPSNGQECDLSPGDVITRLTDTPDADQKVNASVQASKKGDCGAGQQVAVSVEDLQDMRNHFQEQLDSGMKDLAQKQGKGGLPKAPDTGTVASDVPPPPPDTDAAKELTDQEKAADETETQVEQESAAAPNQ